MAKLYIYRNLHRGLAFSIRLRGRVIDRQENFIARNVTFLVSQAGRAQVLTRRRKVVHAYVVAEHYELTQQEPLGLTGVRYNPYQMDTFQVNGQPIFVAKAVLFHQGRCYLLDEESDQAP